MPELTINDVLDELSRYIWLNDRGQLVMDSQISRILDPDKLNLLRSCVEDNIRDDDYPMEPRSGRIDYAAAVKDFKETCDADKD